MPPVADATRFPGQGGMGPRGDAAAPPALTHLAEKAKWSRGQPGRGALKLTATYDGKSFQNRPLPPLAIPATLQDSLAARLDRLAPVKEIAQIGAGWKRMGLVLTMRSRSLGRRVSECWL